MSDWRAALSAEERSLPRRADGYYEKYGVTFRDVQPDDLELMRQWRNHPSIRERMVYREEITVAMQQAWFASIDPARDRYSVLEFRGERVGTTQLRHIDPVARSAEGGITLWRPEDQNGLLSYRVAIAGMDWDFLEFDFARLDVTVLKTNIRALRFVVSLGYRLHDPDPRGEIMLGVVDAESYFPAVKQWREVLHGELRALGEALPAARAQG